MVVFRMGEFLVSYKTRQAVRGIARMVDEGEYAVVHERWCPRESAPGKPFCLCKPSFRESRRRRRARATA